MWYALLLFHWIFLLNFQLFYQWQPPGYTHQPENKTLYLMQKHSFTPNYVSWVTQEPKTTQARDLKQPGVIGHSKLLQSCPNVWPHRQQPTRVPGPWDSPGYNTGVGCHFLLQCEKWKWSHSVVFDSATSWTAACQAPPSIGLSRQE